MNNERILSIFIGVAALAVLVWAATVMLSAGGLPFAFGVS